MRVVVACDKFKGSLTAAEVADSLGRGLRATCPAADVHWVPIADGGDGTLAAAMAAGFERCPVTVAGPTGELVATAWARRGALAVVELADASGLARLGHGHQALTASTRGTGQVVAAAIQAGCREIVLGVGGSSSTDGGAGMVTAMGAQVLDAAGRSIGPGGLGLANAALLDLTGLRNLLAGVHVILASDVDNPLLGPDGAAAAYAPQKGATPDEVTVLEAALSHWAELVALATGRDLRDLPGAGAAGGAGFGALALLDAKMRPGIETVLQLVDFDDAVRDADLVITGEGSLDEQSLRGKAPIGVQRAAARRGVPVIAVCGRTTLSADALRDAGFEHTWALTDREPDPARSMADAARLLEEVGRDLGRELVGRSA